MTAPTLADFLLARIAEDEEASQQVDITRWNSRVARLDVDLYPHMMRQHPARALAECEAKRRIVRLHGRRSGVVGAMPPSAPSLRCAECAAKNDPCPTLRALAQPYASHPDFREEWRA